MADDVSPRVTAQLVERSQGMCEICHRRRATDKHHRLFRSRAHRRDSSIHTIENLLAACGPGNVAGCHGRAHGPDPLEGTAISRYDDRPIDEISFVDALGYRWKLNTDGTKEKLP
jgi:hypothetical protein